jgi:hypothetical protein
MSMQYAAYYFDGKTAARNEVLIEAKGGRLVITHQSGAHIDTWRFRRIKRSHPILKEGPLRLRKGNYGDLFCDSPLGKADREYDSV